ncbi:MULTISPECIES: NAD(P)-binding domain-containing protein [Pseudomonas]|uniref:NAD(P)-binding domain-containing protein n=1 Tax=Pseudomonas TaxID=286 RepID=UPI000BA2FC24|nr:MULTISPECIES: NAD(P)-binding domain-containing protein [Pseudomonas]MDR9862707.1 NAD(P)-binding domain-containing protein [Pseudomonas baetica]
MYSVLFIGKGTITSSLAKFLATKQWNVAFHQRSAGALVTLDLSQYDFVVSCLPDAVIADKVWRGLLDLALASNARNTQFIELSTLTCKIIVDINDSFCRANLAFFEAPFTGSRSGAITGSLIYFASSDYAPPECNAFLQATSSKIYTFDKLSAATQFKLFYNLWGLSCLGLMGQMLPLMNSLQQRDLAFEIITSNNDFWMGAIARQKLSQSLSENYEDIHCKLKYAIKDIRYALAEFSENRLDMSQHLLSLLESENARPYDEFDFTSMHALFK